MRIIFVLVLFKKTKQKKNYDEINRNDRIQNLSAFAMLKK